MIHERIRRISSIPVETPRKLIGSGPQWEDGATYLLVLNQDLVRGDLGSVLTPTSFFIQRYFWENRV